MHNLAWVGYHKKYFSVENIFSILFYLFHFII